MIRNVPQIRVSFSRPLAIGDRPAPAAAALQRLVTAQRIARLRRDAPRGAR